MNLDKIKKQWEEYNEEFANEEIMDIDTHTSMALKVGELITEIDKLGRIVDKKVWVTDIEAKLNERMEYLEDIGAESRLGELMAFMDWLLCGEEY